MVRMRLVVAISVVAVLFFSSLPISQASKKPVPAARKQDIPFIKCQVCQKLGSQLHHQVNKKQSQISPKKISEFQIIEIAEGVCNLKKEQGDWIFRIDIVEKGDALELVEHDVEGQCNSECKTIERACQEVMGYYDTDVAEYLYKTKPQVDSLVNYLCDDLSQACSVKPPPVPKDRTPGEPFVPKPSKDAEMEKILRSMEGMPGAPNMKMYSRDDLLNMQNFGNQDADEDDDDDNDNDRLPSSVGKAMREKQSAQADWKQRILQGMRDKGSEIKKHVNKASFQIRKWWKGLGTRSKATKSEL